MSIFIYFLSYYKHDLFSTLNKIHAKRNNNIENLSLIKSFSKASGFKGKKLPVKIFWFQHSKVYYNERKGFTEIAIA